eukprot:364033-Chlamydomonas_euryale.AAC.12
MAAPAARSRPRPCAWRGGTKQGKALRMAWRHQAGRGPARGAAAPSRARLCAWCGGAAMSTCASHLQQEVRISRGRRRCGNAVHADAP